MLPSNCCHKFIVKKVDLEQKKRKVCKRCGFVDYKNPKIVTGSLVIKNKKILDKAYNDKKGYTAKFSLNLINIIKTHFD